MDKKYTVLIVDDKSENLHYLNKILKDENLIIKATTDPMFALESSKLYPPNLILLDIKMPQIDGFEVCKFFKKEENLKDIPIIFISALDDVNIKVKAFERGGVDYITKPFEKEEIIARIKTQLKIFEKNQTILKLLKQQDFFLKKIIHDMNTPMSVISLNVDSIERDLGPKKELEAIKASSKTLSSIYNDMYFLIKKESALYKIEEINLIKFLSSRILFFDEVAKLKNIIMELEIEEEFNIQMCQYELERIVDNTISNAIKYGFEESEIIISLYNNEDFHILEIANMGEKVEDTDLIFKEYYQQSQGNFGLGLGLNIVKQICEKNNIEIEVKSDDMTRFLYKFKKNNK